VNWRRLAISLHVLALSTWAAPSGVRAAPVLQAPVVAEIHVRIDPGTRELVGSGRWRVAAGVPLRMSIDNRFAVTALRLDGHVVDVAGPSANGRRSWQAPPGQRDRQVEIAWRGRLDALQSGLDHRAVLTQWAPVADPRGSFLPAASYWHPVFEGTGLEYRISLDVPGSQRAIVPGQLLSERIDGERRVQTYAFSQPESGVSLMCGPYVVTQRPYTSVDGHHIELRTLLHPEVAEVAAGDLEAVARYLGMYEELIGPYPYRSFSIVSSPTPTGYGMPTLTYLGVAVLKLPFIRDTSLGHEVLHSWWGNGVRPPDQGGNWSEGLTTFMADYAYKEQAGEVAAFETRAGWLRDFAALGAAEDRPLTRFTARTHGVDQVVGYGKSAMVFLMLRDAIGVEAFDRGLKAIWRQYQGRVATWDDLISAFGQAAGRDLHGDFDPWIRRSGAPDIRLASATVRRVGDRWQLDVGLLQDPPPFPLQVPLALQLDDGSSETRWARLDRERTSVTLEVARRPTRVELDPRARLFRRLAPGEAPPILRQAMLDPATETVLIGAVATGDELVQRLVDYNYKRGSPASTPGPGPLLIVGLADEVTRYLSRNALPARPPDVDMQQAGVTAYAWTVERSDGAPMTVVMARDEPSLAALARPLPHYGRQSWLVFAGATVVARGVWPLCAQQVAPVVR